MRHATQLKALRFFLALDSSSPDDAAPSSTSAETIAALARRRFPVVALNEGTESIEAAEVEATGICSAGDNGEYALGEIVGNVKS